MRRLLIVALLTFNAPVLAQQQQISPAEAALQIGSIASAMAQTMAQQGKTIDELQKQLAAKEARIKELEHKTDDK